VRIGMTVGLGLRSESTMDSLAGRVEALAAQGFATVWMPCGSGFDPLTALPVAGRATAGIELGTAIMPTWPRHPAALAQQALTADDALRGRLTLGIGASHEVMMSHDLGIPFERPARHTREYLSVLGPLLAGEPVCFRGEVFSVDTQLLIRRDARVVPVLLAAMGPAMLRLAGAATTGTITSWTGPRTIADYIVPAISAAAQAAGRPAPRIVVGLPIGLTADPDGLRARLARQTDFYESLPSYQATRDREGVAALADLAILGDEAHLDAALARLADGGATDFAAQLLPLDESTAARTTEFLASRATARVAG
jgi:5,10-methylenetetrahydromethanopterin reductase